MHGILKHSIFIAAAAIALLALLPVALGQTEASSVRQLLPAEVSAEFEVAGEESIRFAVDLTADEFFQVRVAQQNFEILLRFLDPAGHEVARMSSPTGKEGLETLTFVGSQAGRYFLTVGLLDPKSGKSRFAIRREPLRKATARDRRRVEVERVFAEGMTARDAPGQAETAIKKFSEALRGWQELGDGYMVYVSGLLVKRSQARALFIEARDLINLPESESSEKTYRSALTKSQEARRLFHEGGETSKEGAALLGAALAAQGLGDLDSTIDFVELALPIYSSFEDRAVKAALLDNLSMFDLVRDDIDTAVSRLLESRSIYHQLAMAEDQARVENALGSLYLQIGKFDDTERLLESSRQLRSQNPSKCGLALTETSLGLYYYYVNKKAKAKEFLLNLALQHYPAGGECAGEKAQTQIVIGKLFYDLGGLDLAKKYLVMALENLSIESTSPKLSARFDFEARSKSVDNRRNTATALNYLGATNFAAARYREASIPLSKSNSDKAAGISEVNQLYGAARSSYEEALKLNRTIQDKKREATVLTNLGVVQAASGQIDEALQTFNDALKVSREADDVNGQGITLDNIGSAHSARGDHRQALDYFKRALPLLAAAGDKTGEAVALSDAMNAWGKIGNRRMAIFCGKRAVNIFQELRSAAKGLDTEIQKDYLRSIRNSYRRLAELLIDEGQHAQAIHILNLYQDQQFYDLDSRALVYRAEPSSRESEWGKAFDSASRILKDINTQIEAVKRRRTAQRLTNDERNDQLNVLKLQLKNGEAEFLATISRAEKDLAQSPGANETAEATSVAKMQDAISSLMKPNSPQRAFAIYTFIGTERLYVLLITPQIKAFSYPVPNDVLQRRIITFLSDLKNPAFPEKVRDSGSALYKMILGAVLTSDKDHTLEAELELNHVTTLLWSLDGMLSYMPVTALYDARSKQYLVERYQNVLFTRPDPDRILRLSPGWTTAIGFGKSTASQVICPAPCDNPPCDQRLGALPLVARETAAIFRQHPRDRVRLKGFTRLNQSFTRSALLQAKQTSLVHIASHFCFQPGDASASFLLMGDESKFSLEEMRGYKDLFAGVDLLVLSACQTAALQPNNAGKEVDSLAELVQRLGAASVIATLWNADDIGASRLMVRFYALAKQRPDFSKAELLRRAQLTMLKRQETATNMNLDHPYYWAPFVLYGSFRSSERPH